MAAMAKRHRFGLAAVGGVLALVLAGGIYAILNQRARPALVAEETVGPSLADLQISRLTTRGKAQSPAISPDGEFHCRLRAAGRDRHQPVDSPNVHHEQRADRACGPGAALRGVTVTPDGNFVDFVRRKGRTFELWRVPFSWRNPESELIDDVWTAIGWSPDGQHLAFVRDNTSAGSTALIVADADGSHEHVLLTRQTPKVFFSLAATVGALGGAPSLSPDGRLMVLGGLDRTGSSPPEQIVVVDVAAGTEQVNSRRPFVQPERPGVDGRRIAPCSMNPVRLKHRRTFGGWRIQADGCRGSPTI